MTCKISSGIVYVSEGSLLGRYDDVKENFSKKDVQN